VTCVDVVETVSDDPVNVNERLPLSRLGDRALSAAELDGARKTDYV
jgi:hypothetical protein